jgi:predicted acyltransferase
MENQQFKRLGSLDVLRGFDLFCLVFFQPVLDAFSRAIHIPLINAVNSQFEHVPWEGFAFWDIIMPLFMFMAGDWRSADDCGRIALGFANANYQTYLD